MIVNWLVNAVALYVAARVVPGVTVGGTEALLLAALVIGLVNATIRPFARLITFPITVLTLGLFYFVLNGTMVYLAAALTPGFELEGIVAAILTGLVMSIVATALHILIPGRRTKGKA